MKFNNPVDQFFEIDFSQIASSSNKEKMSGVRRVSNKAIRKGAWTPEEDMKLVNYIRRYGIWNWSYMPKYAG